MRAIVAAVLLIGMIAAPTSYADQTYELKGDTLGMTLADFRAKYARSLGPTETPAPMCSDTSPTALYVKLPVTGIGIIRCLQHYPFEEKLDSRTRRSIPPTTIANVPARIIYGFIAHSLDSKDDGAYRLYTIYGSFSSGDYAKVRDAVTEKYGEPSHREEVILQNRLGAVLKGEVLVWTRGDNSIRLSQYAGTIETSSLSIADAKQVSEHQRREKAKQGKQGSKDL
jgi:hypothetical protein